jgi:predicted DCC family thiol-disulfide oxidoreductase YuxK
MDAYFTIDGRSLALCRIGLALVLIVDLLRRVRWIRDFYSNSGLLPNHTMLWRPWQSRVFSIFFMASLPEEVGLLFVITLFCFVCFLVGWRTRLFHLLSLALAASLHNRILIAENGGTVALGILMFWTAFLPLGRRYSVDALLRSLRASPSERPADIAAGKLPPPDTRPAVTLAALAVILQLIAVYWFNYVHKSGGTWHSGTAVYYVLLQERIVTVLGLWLRQHLPFAATKAMTVATIGIELSAPFLLATPIFWRAARRLAIVLLVALHAGIALLVNVGIFSAAMIAYYPLLIDGALWDWLAGRVVPTAGRQRTVLYDAGCGVCFQVVRVLARLDVHRRLTWIPNDRPEALGLEAALVDRTIVVVDRQSKRTWTRAGAVAEVLAALPAGRFWAWVLWLPGLHAAAGLAYDAVARNRAALSAWLGLAACSVDAPGGASSSEPSQQSEGKALPPWRLARQSLAVKLREAGVALALLVLGADMSVSNPSIPDRLRWIHRPQWMEAAILYLRIGEGWGMFAPEAPVYDMMVVVDAVTKDGRHVDPYNEVGSRVHSLPVDDIPVRLGHDSMFCDYTLRIPGAGAYHQALLEWIQRYPERTGNQGDAIASFEVFKIEHTPPAPGETHATNVHRTSILKWP